ncbi:MAG: hypothetical protein AAF610_12840 [Pseudomonadota bacterium]
MSSDTIYDPVRVSGADAVTFLNGQFTGNVSTLTDKDTLFGAFCSPKGRTLALAVLVACDDGIELWTPRRGRDDLIAHLSRYILRAKVRFETISSDRSVDVPLPDGGVFSITDPNLEARAAEAGMPLIDERTRDLFVPQMINLDLLGGVDFKKGCYTGQEIVARTHFLGKSKRRLLAYAHRPHATVNVGDTVRVAGGSAAGKVVVVGSDRVLVSLQLRFSDAALVAGDAHHPLGDPLALPYAIPELAPTAE